jgi:hypothetical protein
MFHALVEREPLFSAESEWDNQIRRSYARAAVEAALKAAFEERSYFEALQPFLTFELMKTVASAHEAILRIESGTSALQAEQQLQRELLERLLASSTVSQIEAMGLSSAQVNSLLAAFGRSDVPVEKAEEFLLNAAKELLGLRKKLALPASAVGPSSLRRSELAKALEEGRLEDANRLAVEAAEAGRESLKIIEHAKDEVRLETIEALASAASVASIRGKLLDAADLAREAARLAATTEPALAWHLAMHGAEYAERHSNLFPTTLGYEVAIGIIEEAISRYVPRKLHPIQWAASHITLGNVRSKVAARTGVGVRADYLPALRAYRIALLAPRLEGGERYHAQVHHNIGGLYLSLALLSEGALLDKALGAAEFHYRRALSIREKLGDRAEWALTQSELASVLRRRGAREQPSRAIPFLREVVVLLSAASAVDELSKGQAASVHANLGNAYHDLGRMLHGSKALEVLSLAEQEFAMALQTYDIEKEPVNWALVKNSVASVHYTISMKSRGEKAARHARAAIWLYHESMVVRTQDRMPTPWLSTMNNLGHAYVRLYEAGRRQDPAALHQAYQTYVRGAASCAPDNKLLWTQLNRGRANMALELYKWTEDPQLEVVCLHEACAGFSSTLAAYDREQEKEEWGQSAWSLARSLAQLSLARREPALLASAIHIMSDAVEALRAGAGSKLENAEADLVRMKQIFQAAHEQS